jgi:hypothetical protein
VYPVIRAGNFDAGVGHLSELMELTLTGIDANGESERERETETETEIHTHTHTHTHTSDEGTAGADLPKTWATLRFYTVLLSGLPLIPLPDACPDGADPQRHEAVRVATDSFADWVFRLLDQTFTFIVNHNSMAPMQGGDPKKTDSETRTSEYFFHCTLEVGTKERPRR